MAIVSTSTPATPAWENADSLQNIINEAPTTQMEVLRPIQEYVIRRFNLFTYLAERLNLSKAREDVEHLSLRVQR